MTEFLTSVIRGLGTGSIYTLLGLGFVIIFKSTQVVNFAQPSLMILGAYFTSYFAVTMDLPFALALPAAIIVSAFIGAAVERVALRPMVGEPVFAAAMVTIGVFFALQVVAADLIGLQPRQVGAPWGFGSSAIGGVVFLHRDLAVFVFAAVIVTALVLFFKYSRTGLAMRATAFDQETALAQGIKVGYVFGLSWAIAGGLAAVAGTFVGIGVGVEAGTSFLALKALPAIILGGLDSIPGAVIGGLVIGLAEALTKTYQPDLFPWAGANFDQAVPYIVMLIVLLVRPYGLFGTPEIERV
ncbi:MAG: branched-chain amino acid ABC transporter permease [Actinobacteria bacterium]|nr:branched-chain amino acid ABC transporter permease [Actinomycetota bacterium]